MDTLLPLFFGHTFRLVIIFIVFENHFKKSQFYNIASVASYVYFEWSARLGKLSFLELSELGELSFGNLALG